MRHQLLDLLRCPRCRGPLRLGEAGGRLDCTTCAAAYPVVRGVPRFVPAAHYAGNFGLQWNRFRRTQLDSHSGQPISRDRFLRATGWDGAALRGKRVLDAGCGAGRFAEVALALGAEVVALDCSTAVDACRANLGHHGRIDVVQGDLYALPLRPRSFDFVYSLGVLQHTPDPARGLRALAEQVRAGGELVVDAYERRWQALFEPKYWLRPFTRRIPPERLLPLVARWVPRLLPLSDRLGRIPLAGRRLRRLVPVANYRDAYPLSEEQLVEWSVLDTFDWLAPAYDQPQAPAALRRVLIEAGLERIATCRAGHLVVKGRRP